MSQVLSIEERRWRAEDDARTLSEAQLIKKDAERLQQAKQAAEEMANKKAEEAAAMRNVANQRKKSKNKTDIDKDDNGFSTENKFNVFKRI
jgi:type IV secretory pathway VirB10-like protein